MTVAIYTDGACEPNPGQGGWAFVVYRDGKEIHHECGGSLDTTNNIMEMTGVVKALEWLLGWHDRQFCTVYSDSQYVVKGCNVWRHGWKRAGWRRKGSKAQPKNREIKNLAIWQELDRLLTTAPVMIEWCRGHVGIVGNERADALSNVGRSRAVEASIPASLIAEQLRYEVA